MHAHAHNTHNLKVLQMFMCIVLYGSVKKKTITSHPQILADVKFYIFVYKILVKATAKFFFFLE